MKERMSLQDKAENPFSLLFDFLLGRMDKKRSVGVIAIGITMLFYGIFCLWNWGNGPHITWDFSYLFRNSGIFYYIYMRTFDGIVYLISSIFILRLENWARKLAIIYSSGVVLFGIYVAMRLLPYPLSVLIHDFSIKVLIREIREVIMICLPVVMGLLFIIFFTRPKVKALFSPERGEAESKEAV